MRGATSILLSGVVCLVAARGAVEQPQVPEGFQLNEYARSPAAQNIVAFGVDEQNRLFLVETDRIHRGAQDNRPCAFWLLDDLAVQTVGDRLAMYKKWEARFPGGLAHFTNHEDRVRMLLDRNGDGRAETNIVFAGGFNAPEDGIAAGILIRDGIVLLANIPNLWVLADKTGDGKADVRHSLFTGFGPRVALLGHDMHGLVWGPDNRVYWSIGDRGWHVTNREGRVLHGGGIGAVFRCDPDGANLETFYTSLRNPQELAFDDAGNLFTVDNNSDAGDKARVTYLIEGGETGWNMRYQTLDGDNSRGPWTQEKLWHPKFAGQPAWITPPLRHLTSGPSGFSFYPGTGLPEKYSGSFFICDFTGSGSSASVMSFQLEQDGAGYRVVNDARFMTKTLPTDVDFGYDGCIYVSDWINGWDGKGQGAVWRIRPEDPKLQAQGAAIGAIFRAGFRQRTSDQLVQLLASPDYRVRLRSHLELARRAETARLAGVANRSSGALARRHAIWALGIIGRKSPAALDGAAAWLADADPEIRAQACRVIGDAGLAGLAPALTAALDDGNDHVRSLAAIALGKLRAHAAEPAVLDLLAKNADRDPWLRHAGIMALAGVDSAEQVHALLQHTNGTVRLAAVVALRRLNDARVADALTDANELVAVEAARAVHDLPLEPGLPKLAGLVGTYRGGDPAMLRRIISANFWLGEPARAEAVARLLERPLPGVIHQEVVNALKDWPAPKPRDRVTGEFRALPDRSARLDEIAAALRGPVIALSQSGQAASREAALKLAKIYRITMGHDLHLTVFRDVNASDDARCDALVALARDANGKTFVREGIGAKAEAVRIEARKQLASLDPTGAIAELTRAAETGARDEAQAAVATLASLRNHPAADAQIAAWLAALRKGTLRKDIWLDVVEGAKTMSAAEVKAALADYQSGLPAGDLLAARRVCMDGGNVGLGKALFQEERAMCAKCHKVNKVGGSEAGPDLGGVAGRRKPEELLLSLMDPNAQIAEGFKAPSPMPPMGLILPPRELRDLIAYLSSLAEFKDESGDATK